MPSSIQLIVGLANPGKEYADTRHNAGAWFVEETAKAFIPSLEPKQISWPAWASTIARSKLPFTDSDYIHESQRSSCQACMNYHKIPADAILVAHDEIDLPAGTIKLKFDGGDGGHNGLKDIIRHLNTKQFYRLRIGVGHPGSSKDVVDYVLDNPSKADRLKIDDAIDTSARCAAIDNEW